MSGTPVHPKSKSRLLAGVAGGLLMFVLWTVALADLSGQESPIVTRDREDGLPDIAASSNGGYLALAWSRGHSDISGPAGYVYLDVAEVAAGKWGLSVKVYPTSATDSNAAREARVVFDPRPAQPTRLHLVWNQKTASGFSQVLYATCDVANTSNCAVSAIATESVVNDATTGPNQPDIAVDASGRRHVVWVDKNGDIKYKCRPEGGAWGATITVRNAVTATQPSIVYAGNRVHASWTDGDWTQGDNDIGYARADVSSSCATSFTPILFDVATSAYRARDPKIAALNDAVYLVWGINTGEYAAPPVETNVYTYYLVYNHSSDGGTTWDRPDGASPEYLDIPSGSTTFTGRPVFYNRLPSGYNYDYGRWLHPNLTLELAGSNTIAHVVWQESAVDWENNNGTFNIFYTTHDGTGWGTPISVTNRPATEDIFSVMPGVAVDNAGQAHLSYMTEKEFGQQTPEDWDIYYYGVLEGPPQSVIYLPIILKNR